MSGPVVIMAISAIVLCAIGFASIVALTFAMRSERRAHRQTRAALARERATTEAARVLYGEARMREAAARVAMREKE